MHLTDLGARVDEVIAQAVVIPFAVIMLQELTNGLAQWRFAEEDQAVETLFIAASHKALLMSIEVWRSGRQPHGRDAGIP